MLPQVRAASDSLFRSEPMKYVHLLMTHDSAYEVMTHLGAFGKLHLVDLGAIHEAAALAASPAGSGDEKAGTRGAPGTGTGTGTGVGGSNDLYMYYKKRLAACYFWERKLQDFREAMVEHGVVPPAFDVEPLEERFPDSLEALKNYLEPLEQTLDQHVTFKKKQTQRINELIERAHVLEKCKQGPLMRRATAESKEEKSVEGATLSTVVCGVIPVERQAFFERMLFRVSRGNAIVRFWPIENTILDPLTGDSMLKVVFRVVFIGDQLKNRVNKICSFVGASVYPIPAEAQQIEAEIQDIQQRMNEYSSVLMKTKDDIHHLLAGVAFDSERKTPLRREGDPPNYQTFGNDLNRVSPLVNWEWTIHKEKLICMAFKKCDLAQSNRSNVISAEGWVPVEDLDNLRSHLEEAAKRSQEPILHVYENDATPPTHFKLNKYTQPFQSIVNTYGVPRYQEANPGLFTIITFPFLFGVMYGDIGHGILMTLGAIFFIWKEAAIEKGIKLKQIPEMVSIVFGGRYLLILMGFFAIYCGAIYNDCVSIPLSLYESGWTHDKVAVSTGVVYPFGLDPGWFHTKNELTFFNSFKMKLSVILGVIQMTFGICLSFSNHVHFGDYLSIAFEFLPQLLFMLCTFGYMIFLIIFKWTIDWSASNMQPPNLIQTMIGMFLSPGSVDPSRQLYAGQGPVQAALVLIAFLSVPVMLLVKPCIVRSRHLALEERGPQGHESGGSPHELKEEDDVKINVKSDKKKSPSGGGGGHDGHGGSGPYSFSDHLITQGIHTIEFVLGAVSNTASYLRLWALSLAHAELAQVFWEKMIMQYGIDKGPFFTIIGFAVWAAATFGVLLCMDVLECFLHALRLHWVEFQNKFFHADGYAFEPFDFHAKTAESSV